MITTQLPDVKIKPDTDNKEQTTHFSRLQNDDDDDDDDVFKKKEEEAMGKEYMQLKPIGSDGDKNKENVLDLPDLPEAVALKVN